MEMVNMHEKQLFMDGKKLVAIISEAGSAGVSLQADRRAVNQVEFCDDILYFHRMTSSVCEVICSCAFVCTLRNRIPN